MSPSTKLFAERLNHCLNDLGAPAQARERATILSKILNIPKQQAWSLIEGHQYPDQDFLNQLAQEFEVDSEWLAGNK